MVWYGMRLGLVGDELGEKNHREGVVAEERQGMVGWGRRFEDGIFEVLCGQCVRIDFPCLMQR